MEESENKDLNKSPIDFEQMAGVLPESTSSIITARGTIDGLVIRLDGRVDRDSLKSAVEEFLDARKAFLAGQEVALEWVGARPEENLVTDLSSLLRDNFQISVRSSKLRESPRPSIDVEQGNGFSSHAATGRPKSLFDGMEVLSETRMEPTRPEMSVIKAGAKSETFWDDADARIIYSTLRSGQKIETEHSLIVFGDVNSGAEIIAGGDIVVLGTLRGVAHAGAYDETGGGRGIFALNLQATQLRIGMVISRGSSESPQKSPELARVEGGLIVVEPYSVKNLGNRRRD